MENLHNNIMVENTEMVPLNPQVIEAKTIKTCTKCKMKKEITEFHTRKGIGDGYRGVCKECKNARAKECAKTPERIKARKQYDNSPERKLKKSEYFKNHKEERRIYNQRQEVLERNRENSRKRYYENKDKIREQVKQSRNKNRDKINEQKRNDYHKNKEKILLQQKLKREENPEAYREKQRQRRQNRLEEKRKYDREYSAKRRAEDIKFRIMENLRNRLRLAVKNNQKAGGTLELIGCDIDVLKQRLSSKFKPGMTWENYGDWHIDHIIPCCVFDLTIEENQRKCFHYSNLQPLWEKENLAKIKSDLELQNSREANQTL